MHKMWVLGLIFFLTACIRPHYTPQYVDTPDSWRFEADEASTLCNLNWWEQFQDPVLNKLILTALQNNQDLQVAISRVFEFYAQLGVISSGLYPAIDGNASYNRIESSIATPVPLTSTPGVSRINNDFQAFFNLSWELDFWGRICSAVQAAYADVLATIEVRRGVVLTLVSSVANAYIVLRQLDAQLEVSKKTLKSRIESLDLAKIRFELGETSEMEVFMAESELEVAAIQVLQFERDIPRQENLISVLLGENPQAIERGKTIETFKYPVTIPAGLPSELLIRRPDILEAEDRLVAANARVTEARALFFPQITLTGMYGSESDQLSTFLTSPARMWQWGFSVVQFIFDAGKRYYGVMETEAIRDEALFNYRQKILTAFREVNDALITCQMNQKLVVENEKQVTALAGYLRLSLMRYNEGQVDYLNVLDAERSLFNAQLQLVQAQSDNFTAVVNLYSALGGGWVSESDTYAISQAALQECENRYHE